MAVVVIMAVMAAAMAAATVVVVIMNLAIRIQINLLVLKAGKIEVMETLLKTLNLKVEEAGGKEEFHMMVIYQVMRTNNPFLQV
jgi:hypothetical protein